MLFKDFREVESFIINKITHVARKRAESQYLSDRIENISDYDPMEDDGYEKSVEPLNAALKALRESYIKQIDY